jgi:hypothetical protein
MINHSEFIESRAKHYEIMFMEETRKHMTVKKEYQDHLSDDETKDCTGNSNIAVTISDIIKKQRTKRFTNGFGFLKNKNKTH